MIHPVLPFLPHDRSRLHSNLANITPTVRKAFFSALFVFAHPGRYDPLPCNIAERSYMEPANLVFALQREDRATQPAAERLVVLQTILLMILATEMTGPANIEYRGWYTQAFGTATFLFGHLRRVRETDRLPYHDPDDHQLLARRAWLSFVTLERWHSAGTFLPTICPDELTELVADDRMMLGDAGYFLLRKSFSTLAFAARLTHARLIFRTWSYHRHQTMGYL